ncbi:MAG: GNAT family N-acetyltransferase [Betaproteobacteria bacterium]|nr:MAG: GNAT family N-acetyltransferase [Betaproteobacteria bacterium]
MAQAMALATVPAHYLAPLLAPRSVAIVGASSRPESVGRIVYENLLAGGFRGELFAVNPNHKAVLGRPAYASLAAIGHPIDLAVICAPPAAVPEILELRRGDLRAAVILSDAPSADATAYRRWRHDLAERARASGVRILGPASFGIVRTSLGLNATVGAVAALPGRVSLISQSGAIAIALLDFARTAGIGFASVVAFGAGSDIETSELLEFALIDPETDGIVLYLETVRDARRFMSALRVAARAKPVVVLKAGRGDPPATAHAPTPDDVFDAALRRAGTVRVSTYTQLFAAARILAAGRVPHGNRVAIITNGRGPGLLAEDRAAEAGVALADLTRETRDALGSLLPPGSRVGNPIDLRGEAPPERFAAALSTMLADVNVDAAIVLQVTTPAAPPTDTARAVAAAAKSASKPVLAAWLGAVDRREAGDALEAGGLANFFTPENAVEAFAFLAAYRRNQQWLLETPPPQSEVAAPNLVVAERIRVHARARATKVLSAQQTQALLAAFDMALAPTVSSRLRNRGACDAGASAPTRVKAVHLGVYRDAVFGPVIALRTTRGASVPGVMLPPLNHRLAADLVDGACGRLRAAEHGALIALLLKVSTLVCALPWVIELELVAVAAISGKATPARARVLIDPKRRPAVRGYRHMAIHPYPVELETTLAVKGGRPLRVRAIRPEDAVAERAFVAGLSEESRYMRFMHHLHELTPQMLARFTQVDYDRELALVALHAKAGAEKIVAVARYVANPDGESAEFAIVVADAWQGRGLGRALMRMLIGCARERGFRRLEGVILATNTSMLALMARLGFKTTPDPNDREQVIATLDL